MAIDVKTEGSPGWWMLKACRKREERLPRLQKLANYHDGEPPVPTSNVAVTEAFRQVQKQSRTNLAELIVGSLRERIAVREIRTAVSGSNPDEEAWAIWRDNGLDVEFSDVIENMLALGDGYMICGMQNGELAITGEDPRQVVTIHNPVRQSEIRAGVKVFHDPDVSKDYVYLYVAGKRDVDAFGAVTVSNARRYVASRSRKNRKSAVIFSPAQFEWDESFGGAEGEELPSPLVPIVRFRNRRGVGEFEPHLDVLDRVNHNVYNRMIIAIYQAFRQRVVKVDVDEVDEFEDRGQSDVDLNDVLTSDPGSWIQLPKDSDIWESGQADMQGILSATKDDIRLLAAVTRRPMSMFAPDNESASGAHLTHEGLRFAVEDKHVRAGQALVDLYHLAFLTKDDPARADKSKIIIGFTPAERYSITDKASATSQVSTVWPLKTINREIWQMNPEESAQVDSEQADSDLFNAAREVTPDGADEA